MARASPGPASSARGSCSSERRPHRPLVRAPGRQGLGGTSSARGAGYTTACDNLLHSAKGRNLKDVHLVVGIAVLARNLLAGVWGAVAWARHDPSVWFWYLLRVAQAVVVGRGALGWFPLRVAEGGGGVQVTLGLILLATDHRTGDELHYVYGVSLLIVTLVTEGMRAGAAQRELDEVDDVDALTPVEQREVARRVVLREMGLMTIGALLVTTLALRAAMTGG